MSRGYFNAPSNRNRRNSLRHVADETLDILETGEYTSNGVRYSLKKDISSCKEHTTYHAPDCSILSRWSTPEPTASGNFSDRASFDFLEKTTLQAARFLTDVVEHNTRRGAVGVLNFASATKPGGGFINGAQAQEESIARASTLHASLTTEQAEPFYEIHKDDDRIGFYTHAMIYSPAVVIFRDNDDRKSVPFKVDVLTSAAVNAGEVRKRIACRDQSEVEWKIENEMRERMGRILYAFVEHKATNIILGSFGTGVFRNDVSVVAGIWADLLAVPGARFEKSFERVIFAITGTVTFDQFKAAFHARVKAAERWARERESGRAA
jgi:uncharacterized protein (TIGR02452 family)